MFASSRPSWSLGGPSDTLEFRSYMIQYFKTFLAIGAFVGFFDGHIAQPAKSEERPSTVKMDSRGIVR